MTLTKINFSSVFLGNFDWGSKHNPIVVFFFFLGENAPKTLIVNGCVGGEVSKLGTPDCQDHTKSEH